MRSRASLRLLRHPDLDWCCGSGTAGHGGFKPHRQTSERLPSLPVVVRQLSKNPKNVAARDQRAPMGLLPKSATTRVLIKFEAGVEGNVTYRSLLAFFRTPVFTRATRERSTA